MPFLIPKYWLQNWFVTWEFEISLILLHLDAVHVMWWMWVCEYFPSGSYAMCMFCLHLSDFLRSSVSQPFCFLCSLSLALSLSHWHGFPYFLCNSPHSFLPISSSILSSLLLPFLCQELSIRTKYDQAWEEAKIRMSVQRTPHNSIFRDCWNSIIFIILLYRSWSLMSEYCCFRKFQSFLTDSSILLKIAFLAFSKVKIHSLTTKFR